MAQRYSTTPQNIIVQEIVKGSIFVKFYFENNTPSDGAYSQSDKPHLKGRLVKEEQLFTTLQLSEQDFDSRGDIDFVAGHQAEAQVRGFFPYYQPAGWIRYGLNIKKYGEDEKIWLAMNGNAGEWAVAYHGVRSPAMLVPNTKSNTQTTVARSIRDNQLMAGGGQAYIDSEQTITNSHVKAFNHFNSSDEDKIEGKKVGRGIYCTPLLETATGYTSDFSVGNDSYRLAFQCRVRPDQIRITSLPDYWVISNSKFIRPYGLLISKTSHATVEFAATRTKFRNEYHAWVTKEKVNTPH